MLFIFKHTRFTPFAEVYLFISEADIKRADLLIMKVLIEEER